MHIGIVTIYVNDQDRAKEFYTKKLGWHVVDDSPMGENMRWLSVAPHGAQTAAVLAKGFGDWTPEKVGTSTGIVLEVEDIFEDVDLLKRKGVEFTTEPSVEFFGGWAMLKDSEGNLIGVHSPPPAAAREMMP
jgi:predicted enzyme related to lactoylglutathione lyase